MGEPDVVGGSRAQTVVPLRVECRNLIQKRSANPRWRESLKFGRSGGNVPLAARFPVAPSRGASG